MPNTAALPSAICIMLRASAELLSCGTILSFNSLVRWNNRLEMKIYTAGRRHTVSKSELCQLLTAAQETQWSMQLAAAEQIAAGVAGGP